MIRLNYVCLRAGDFKLSDISFTVPAASYGVLMGRTGSGKSTLMEAICGLRPVQSGRIFIGDSIATHEPPGLRNIGYVPQDGALFTTQTVEQQLGFALKLRQWHPKQIKARVEELAELLKITKLLSRTPEGLSGGEAQRVALGRALSFRPSVLCLDEPLSALDHDTRLEMTELLISMQRELKVTVLHITHDRREAESLGDVIFQLKDGKIVTGDNLNLNTFTSPPAAIQQP